MSNLANELRQIGTAFHAVADTIDALRPILDALDRAEILKYQRRILIVKMHTLGLTYLESKRLES